MFGIKENHFDPYNVLAIATNIPQRLKTGFVLTYVYKNCICSICQICDSRLKIPDKYYSFELDGDGEEEFTILSHTKTTIIIIIFWLTDLNLLMDELGAQLFGSNKGIQIFQTTHHVCFTLMSEYTIMPSMAAIFYKLQYTENSKSKWDFHLRPPWHCQSDWKTRWMIPFLHSNWLWMF